MSMSILVFTCFYQTNLVPCSVCMVLVTVCLQSEAYVVPIHERCSTAAPTRRVEYAWATCGSNPQRPAFHHCSQRLILHRSSAWPSRPKTKLIQIKPSLVYASPCSFQGRRIVYLEAGGQKVYTTQFVLEMSFSSSSCLRRSGWPVCFSSILRFVYIWGGGGVGWGGVYQRPDAPVLGTTLTRHDEVMCKTLWMLR